MLTEWLAREVIFEEGCIGAEDVVLDARFSVKGTNYSSTIKHNAAPKRVPFKPYMKQMRNYGYTRMVANKDGLKSHVGRILQ